MFNMGFERPRGIMERAYSKLRARTRQNGGIVDLDFIIDYIYELQEKKFDAHTIICGLQGVGKSTLMLILMRLMLKKMGLPPDFQEAEGINKLKFLYAYNTRAQFIKEITDKKLCVFGIDEIKTFFDHRRYAFSDQVNAYNMLEIARSHSNAYIGCTRELDKLLIDYRNAKCGLLIRLMDRVEYSGGLYVYGMVFVGNPAIEIEDKFMQEPLKMGLNFETTIGIAKRLPTFVGMLVAFDAKDYGVTDADIALYETEKERGIQEYSNISGNNEKDEKKDKKRGRPRKWRREE